MADITAAELTRKRDTIKKELSALQQQAAVAKADEARIKQELKEALEELKTTYGCSSYDEAVKKRDSLLEELDSMSTDLEERISAIRSQ